ncbi:uncharacterized protein [Dermacentor albipictus]|uniref:uncharacterized protein n=1 Tax=Dermacentor albipictus TaxID=60249 RepID=UPI0038FCAE19
MCKGVYAALVGGPKLAVVQKERPGAGEVSWRGSVICGCPQRSFSPEQRGSPIGHVRVQGTLRPDYGICLAGQVQRVCLEGTRRSAFYRNKGPGSLASLLMSTESRTSSSTAHEGDRLECPTAGGHKKSLTVRTFFGSGRTPKESTRCPITDPCHQLQHPNTQKESPSKKILGTNETVKGVIYPSKKLMARQTRMMQASCARPDIEATETGWEFYPIWNFQMLCAPRAYCE